ncbi:MAG: hypothetical protein KF847_20805 [Pirellulales bacterium]|nr:hypothetical protein [Pirellulales bacterium]
MARHLHEIRDANGNGTWDLDQARTSNVVNEITDITETAGPSWATPAYNRAGNMTTVPKPAAPTGGYTATYDAWNRLVKLADGSDTVSEYSYDGAQRRIVQLSYVAGTLSETRHLYYTDPSQWQVIEERLGASTDADRQFVWGLRYVDDCLLRDRDSDSNGSLDERLYALQDANWNVTGLVDPDGDVQERFAYTAYGVPLFLAANFTPQGASGSGWEPLYCGYRHEAATGLFHVRHRVLHPVLGVWVQRDLASNDPGPHLYKYAASSPITFVDASGLKEIKPPNAAQGRKERCRTIYFPQPKNAKVGPDVSKCFDKRDWKSIAKCIAGLTGKDVAKEIIDWAVNVVCCNLADSRDEDPCQAGHREDLRDPNNLIECNPHYTWPPPRDAKGNPVWPPPTDCQGCCEFLGCREALLKGMNLKKAVLAALTRPTYSYIGCTADCA